MEKYISGDIVRLKSGGPLMTLNFQKSSGEWSVIYFDKMNKSHELILFPDAFKKTDEKDEDARSESSSQTPLRVKKRKGEAEDYEFELGGEQ